MSVPGLPATQNGSSKKALGASRKGNSQPAPLKSKAEEEAAASAAAAANAASAGSKDQTGRPNRQQYDQEQEQIKAEIAKLQEKSNAVRAKIQASQGKGPSHDRKVELRTTLQSIRDEQAQIKGARGKTLDGLKAQQDALAKAIKDLQLAKQKAPFKSTAEVDAKIKQIEQRIESGTMKLVDEKKALAEVQALKKQRKQVDQFASQQEQIDADRKKIDETRAALDSPEARALSEKYDKAKQELDKINKENEDASKGRDALFDERNALSKEIDALYARKKESAAAFKEANDKYYQKMNEERQKRAERQKAERAAHEEAKRAEHNERLLEEAQAPAFEREIEDCSTLIDFFKRRIGLPVSAPSGSAAAKNRLGVPADASLPKLGEARQVDALEGVKLLSKKREDEDDFFSGSSSSKKSNNKKRSTTGAAGAGGAGTENGDEALQLPYGTLTALLTLGITSPLTTSDVPKTIDALELKRKYFVDNQDRVTRENVAKAEKRIAEHNAKSSSSAANTGTTGGGTTASASSTTAKEATANEHVQKDDKAETTEANESATTEA